MRLFRDIKVPAENAERTVEDTRNCGLDSGKRLWAIELEHPGPLETLFQKKDLLTQDTRSGTSYPIVCACLEWKAPSTSFRGRVPLRVPQRVTASRIVHTDPHVVARRRSEILKFPVQSSPPETITVPAVCREPLQVFPESARLMRMLRPVVASLGTRARLSAMVTSRVV